MGAGASGEWSVEVRGDERGGVCRGRSGWVCESVSVKRCAFEIAAE